MKRIWLRRNIFFQIRYQVQGLFALSTPLEYFFCILSLHSLNVTSIILIIWRESDIIAWKAFFILSCRRADISEKWCFFLRKGVHMSKKIQFYQFFRDVPGIRHGKWWKRFWTCARASVTFPPRTGCAPLAILYSKIGGTFKGGQFLKINKRGTVFKQ